MMGGRLCVTLAWACDMGDVSGLLQEIPCVALRKVPEVEAWASAWCPLRLPGLWWGVLRVRIGAVPALRNELAFS